MSGETEEILTSETGNDKEASENTEMAAEIQVPSEDAAVEPTASKSHEPSSGTDDDEPSSQPKPNDNNAEEIKSEHENEDPAVHPEEKQVTVEEARAAFVNQGLIRWEHARHVWLGDRENGSSDSGISARPSAVPLDVDKIIDILFYSSSRETRAGTAKPEKFPRNVPLPQMVDILQGELLVKRNVGN